MVTFGDPETSAARPGPEQFLNEYGAPWCQPHEQDVVAEPVGPATQKVNALTEAFKLAWPILTGDSEL